MSQTMHEGSPAPSVTSTNAGSRQAPRRQLEMSLHAKLPSLRHSQLLHLLTGVAGHPPNHVRERHILFQPNRVPIRQAAADQGGGSQTIQDKAKLAAARKRAMEKGKDKDGQSWLMRAVESHSQSYEVAMGQGDGKAADESDTEPQTWSWRWYGLPDPNMKAVTARPMEAKELETRDPVGFATAQDFRLSTQYALEGKQFVHHNIVVLIYRLYQWPEEAADLLAQSFEELAPIDSSGAYLIEARVMLADATKNDLISNGSNELTQFKELMQGCVDLRPVDRLALDTRAR